MTESFVIDTGALSLFFAGDFRTKLSFDKVSSGGAGGFNVSTVPTPHDTRHYRLSDWCEVLQNRVGAFAEPLGKDYGPRARKIPDAGAVVLLRFEDDGDSGLQVPVQELRDAVGLRRRPRASALGE